MATLDQADATALVAFEAKYTKADNGIDCPKCGTELNDTHPGLIAIPFPPQTRISCNNAECGFGKTPGKPKYRIVSGV